MDGSHLRLRENDVLLVRTSTLVRQDMFCTFVIGFFARAVFGVWIGGCRRRKAADLFRQDFKRNLLNTLLCTRKDSSLGCLAHYLPTNIGSLKPFGSNAGKGTAPFSAQHDAPVHSGRLTSRRLGHAG